MKISKKLITPIISALACGLGTCATYAQANAGSAGLPQESEAGGSPAPRGGSLAPWGPEAGDWELTLGGNGSNDSDFEAGGFGVSGSLGYFFTKAMELSVRQSISFSDFGSSSWNGATRAAFDYHFYLDRIRPFVGANFGGIYGESVNETFAAGLEAGVKWYVKNETFIFGMGEYQWLFDDADSADDAFDDGQFLYSLGIGFNF